MPTTPVDYLHKVLDELEGSTQTFLKRNDPETLRRKEVLAQLDDLKIRGEELGIKKSQQDIDNLRVQSLTQRAGILAGGTRPGSEGGMPGPPSEDPLEAARDRVRYQAPVIDPAAIGDTEGVNPELVKAAVSNAQRKAEAEGITSNLNQSLLGERVGVQEWMSNRPYNASNIVNPTEEGRKNVIGLSGIDLALTGPIDKAVWTGALSVANSKMRAAQGNRSHDADEQYGLREVLDENGIIHYVGRTKQTAGVDFGTARTADGKPLYRNAPDLAVSQSDRVSGYNDSIYLMDEVARVIESGALGPLTGTLATLSQQKLGSLGLDDRTVEALVLMSKNQSVQAFASGGKALSGNEKQYFIDQLPVGPDTLGAALTKLKVGNKFLRESKKNFITGLPSKRRIAVPVAAGGPGQPTVDASGGVVPAGAPPAPAPNQRVIGQTYMHPKLGVPKKWIEVEGIQGWEQ